MQEEGGANAGAGSEGRGFASSEVAAAFLRAEAAHFRRARPVPAAACSCGQGRVTAAPAHMYTHITTRLAVVNFVKGAGSGAKAPIQLARYVYMLVDGLKS